MKLQQVLIALVVLAVVALALFASSGMVSSSNTSISAQSLEVPLVNGVQTLHLHASAEEQQMYEPAAFTVKKKVPVKILFSADQYAGCGREFILSAFGISVLAQNDVEVPIEFTPDKEGVFPYHCSANRFRGQMTVIP